MGIDMTTGSQSIQSVMDGIEMDLLSTKHQGEDAHLAEFVGGIAENVDLHDLGEAAEEFVGTLRVLADAGIIEQEEALEASFMHGFLVALKWYEKNH